jgi:hypothetical protein
MVDLASYPGDVDVYQPTEQEEFTLGDLHGNTLKLIFCLIKCGIMTLDKGRDDYERIYQIYTSQKRYFKAVEYKNSLQYYQRINRDRVELDKQALDEFTDILSRARFKTIGLLRLIGDELCDRGNSDLLTMVVFDTLKRNNLPYSIQYSNHGIQAIQAFMNLLVDGFYYSLKMASMQENSLISALASIGVKTRYVGRVKPKTTTAPPVVGSMAQKTSVESELIDDPRCCETNKRAELLPLMDKDTFLKSIKYSYYPSLKLIDYSFNDYGEISVFFHGLTGFNVVKSTVDLLNNRVEGCHLDFDDSSPLKIAKTIDEVNEMIYSLVHNRKIDDVYYKSSSYNPISKLLWSREIIASDVFETSRGKPITIVHGHVGEGMMPVWREGRAVNDNLDTLLGNNQNTIPDVGQFLVRVETVSKLTNQCRRFNEIKREFLELDPASKGYIDLFYDEGLSDKEREYIIENMKLGLLIANHDQAAISHNMMVRRFESLKHLFLGSESSTYYVLKLERDFYGIDSNACTRHETIIYLREIAKEFGLEVDDTEDENPQALEQGLNRDNFVPRSKAELMAKKIQGSYRSHRARMDGMALIEKLRMLIHSSILSFAKKIHYLAMMDRYQKALEEQGGSFEVILESIEDSKVELMKDVKLAKLKSYDLRLLSRQRASRNNMIGLTSAYSLLVDWASLKRKQALMKDKLEMFNRLLSDDSSKKDELERALRDVVLAFSLTRNALATSYYRSETNSVGELMFFLQLNDFKRVQIVLAERTLKEFVNEVIYQQNEKHPKTFSLM